MKVQADNSLEPPVEYNQDQTMSLMNRVHYNPFITILGVSNILYSSD